MGNARSEVATVGANGLHGFDQGDHELREIMSLTIRESLFGEFPDSLVGVELRCIGRKALQVDALGASAELAYELAAMGIASVPQDEDVAADLPEELL